MKNKKRIALLFTGMLLVLSTAGCQLADADMRSANDTLIGIYVSKEYIDAFSYYISSSGSLNAKMVDDGRVYGTLDKENETISFPDINGFALLCFQQEENGNTYFSTINEHFSDTSTSIIGESREVSGTLYYDSSKVANHYFEESTEGEDLTLYIHPIYETANGEVYLTAEPGGTFFSQGDISTSFSSSESSTLGGSTTESSYTKFTVSVKAASPVEKIIFTQFDSKGNVLQEDTYTSANMPETYTRKRDSAYILVSSTDFAGNITYSTINQEDETFSLYLPTDDIFCEDASINIED